MCDGPLERSGTPASYPMVRGRLRRVARPAGSLMEATAGDPGPRGVFDCRPGVARAVQAAHRIVIQTRTNVTLRLTLDGGGGGDFAGNVALCAFSEPDDAPLTWVQTGRFVPEEVTWFDNRRETRTLSRQVTYHGESEPTTEPLRDPQTRETFIDESQQWWIDSRSASARYSDAGAYLPPAGHPNGEIIYDGPSQSVRYGEFFRANPGCTAGPRADRVQDIPVPPTTGGAGVPQLATTGDGRVVVHGRSRAAFTRRSMGGEGDAGGDPLDSPEPRRTRVARRRHRALPAAVMRVVCSIALLLAACGAAPARSSRVGPQDERAVRVEPCRDAVHPELVGLWGYLASYSASPPAFRSAFVYDGCHVTISFRCPYVGDTLTTTIDRLALEARLAGELEERRALGLREHRHYGDAHRTHAVWRGDVLVSVSEVSIDVEVARIRESDDGPTLDYAWDTRRPIPLVRFGPEHTLDDVGVDLLRAREVVRRPGEWRE